MLRASGEDPVLATAAYQFCFKINELIQYCQKVLPLPYLIFNQEYQAVHQLFPTIQTAISQAVRLIRAYADQDKVVHYVGKTKQDIQQLRARIELAQRSATRSMKTEDHVEQKVLDEVQDKITVLRSLKTHTRDERCSIDQAVARREMELSELEKQVNERHAHKKELENMCGCLSFFSKSTREKRKQADEELRQVEIEMQAKQESKVSHARLNHFLLFEKMLEDAKKDLLHHLSHLPKFMQEVHDNVATLKKELSDTTSSLRQMAHHAVNNVIMYQVLRIYVLFVEVRQAIRRVHASESVLKKLQIKFSPAAEQELDELLHIIWCPDSGDKCAIDFYLGLSDSHKQLLLKRAQPSAKEVAAIIPPREGNCVHIAVCEVLARHCEPA